MSDSEEARALRALGRALDRLREALAEPETNPLAAVARRIYANVRSSFPEMERTYRLLAARFPG